MADHEAWLRAHYRPGVLALAGLLLGALIGAWIGEGAGLGTLPLGMALGLALGAGSDSLLNHWLNGPFEDPAARSE